MANIVELREMSGEKLEEMLENAREEMFNLRFQKAAAQLENGARIKHVRREIAQLKETLHKRQLAKEAAAAQPEVAAVLKDKHWQVTARFIYEESAWRVRFVDDDGDELAVVMVDLNQRRPKGRRQREKQPQPLLVTAYEIGESGEK